MTAHILYILERFFEESAAFSVPIGGTSQLGETLQRGLEKFGGKLQLNAHVEEIPVEDGRAVAPADVVDRPIGQWLRMGVTS